MQGAIPATPSSLFLKQPTTRQLRPHSLGAPPALGGPWESVGGLPKASPHPPRKVILSGVEG